MAPESDNPQPPEEPQTGPDDAPAEEPIAPDEAGRSQADDQGAAGGGDVPAAEPDAGAATPDLPDAARDDAVDQPATPQDGGEIPEPGPTPEEAQEATDEMVEAGDEIARAAPEPEPQAEGASQAAPDPQGEDASQPEAVPESEAAPEEFIDESPRQKPAIPGAHLEVDIVPEGSDPLGSEAIEGGIEDVDVPVEEPLVTEADVATEPEPDTPAQAVIDLGAGARYRATGKRKTAVARVILRPGEGRYTINGRPLDEHFPRPALQRNIRQPLETVGYDARMDVTASLHGGGVSSQAGALRHGISRALIEADPNLRGELKRRGFLTRDPRVKERKKAGLKKARKRPQFSKR
jgi:small subunit ribosomal protein S9